MPRSQVQRCLEFPVRKTSTRVTRSRKLRAADVENDENSPVKVKSPKRTSQAGECPLQTKKALYTPPSERLVTGEKKTCDDDLSHPMAMKQLDVTNKLPKVQRCLEFSVKKTTPQKARSKKLQDNDENSPARFKSPRRSVQGGCYQQARKALHTALPERLMCREEEMAEVNNFLDGHLKTKSAGSLYISGAPGTGKTAVLSHAMHRLENNWTCTVVYINCMSFRNSQAIYNTVLSELRGKECSFTVKQALTELRKALSTHSKPIVMILDEMDQLDSKNQEVLYTMFEWPSLPKSKLILVGIANALDLTDRILPRLQARPECRPELLHFTPYSKEQIIAVLKDRLQKIEVAGEQVIDPSAIQFCARKVSAVAGDMRKALDVCRRAVEMVEADSRKQQVLASVCNSPSKRLVIPKKIGVAHILKIINEVYGSRVAVQPGQQQTIPLQQKMAVCSLLLMLKHGKAKEVSLGKLHECYSKVCSKQNVSPCEQPEFLSLCSMVESRGIVSLKKKGAAREHKISLKLDEKELEFALQDKTLMSAILQAGLPK